MILSENDLKKLKDHTKGPWKWKGNTDTKSIMLWSEIKLKPIVMDFVRYGMQRAAPRFRKNMIMERFDDLVEYEVPHRRDIKSINHVDAQIIEKCPDLYETCMHLIEENKQLKSSKFFHFLNKRRI